MHSAAFETPQRRPALPVPAAIGQQPVGQQADGDGDRLAAAADWLLRAAHDMLAPDRQSVEDCLSLALARLQGSDGGRDRAVLVPDDAGRDDTGLAAESGKSGPAKSGLAAWQMRRVTAYIDTHLAGSIRNRDLAAAAKLSCGYFCQSFKDSFGCPPHSYILRRRVERAKELLETSITPLSQIALDCGFSDQSHFSRIFRRATGEAPRLWRHKHRIDDADRADRMDAR
ncbi:AraC family transcriptional regulator [Azospirillum palustre]|uniref:AraC family transcriptional regulator n=1 Tax=Azospirillum palustre TaxID=2044885 RepID=A0A2B8BCS6_9PROT|nr:AraC family transcriptional regulator [Azospirillum palustre]PGH55519.1 AraC family transcriptional regulator [Azospirillum palustre]